MADFYTGNMPWECSRRISGLVKMSFILLFGFWIIIMLTSFHCYNYVLSSVNYKEKDENTCSRVHGVDVCFRQLCLQFDLLFVLHYNRDCYCLRHGPKNIQVL